jgi:hypothetical protein
MTHNIPSKSDRHPGREAVERFRGIGSFIKLFAEFPPLVHLHISMQASFHVKSL